MQFKEIQQILKRKANKKTRESFRKFNPSFHQEVYGVKVPVLNEIAKKAKDADFELVERLWRKGVFEERLLATKILGRICKKGPDRTLELLRKMVPDISSWGVCDTLATQAIRKIAKEKQRELLELSRRYVLSKNFWQRRFGLVLLINFSKDKNVKKDIEAILAKVKDDKEPYVKKAVTWLKSKLK